MKIVVIGGSGRVGGKVVRRLSAQGHDPGLADVMAGADAVVDVSNAPVWDDDPVREFFTTSTRNLLAAERNAGVGHHLAVSIASRYSNGPQLTRTTPSATSSGERLAGHAPVDEAFDAHRVAVPQRRG